MGIGNSKPSRTACRNLVCHSWHQRTMVKNAYNVHLELHSGYIDRLHLLLWALLRAIGGLARGSNHHYIHAWSDWDICATYHSQHTFVLVCLYAAVLCGASVCRRVHRSYAGALGNVHPISPRYRLMVPTRVAHISLRKVPQSSKCSWSWPARPSTVRKRLRIIAGKWTNRSWDRKTKTSRCYRPTLSC